MYKFKYINFFLIAFLFSACSVGKQEIDFKKPEVQIPKVDPIPKKNKGSLYSVQGASLFADKKDLQIGDIIQININESLSSTSNNKRELTANRNSNLQGGLINPINNNQLGKYARKGSSTFNRLFGVGFNSTSTTSDSGENKTKLAEQFSTSISAIIEETYQNGNYFIKGSKELLIDGQKQTIIVTGVIRPYDINSDNSVSSAQIANLKLMYDKEGTEADITDTPWGLKLLRAIWPF